jgi:hypothetical protein
MDKRGRKAEKRYRSRTESDYVTISLTIEKNLLDIIDEKVNSTDEKNMSKYIEETVSGCPIEKMPKRRSFKTFPIKKTFTFTKDFVKKIKKSGNMSLYIESILLNKFN